jgi:hypothetical protein
MNLKREDLKLKDYRSSEVNTDKLHKIKGIYN